MLFKVNKSINLINYLNEGRNWALLNEYFLCLKFFVRPRFWNKIHQNFLNEYYIKIIINSFISLSNIFSHNLYDELTSRGYKMKEH